MLDEVEPVEEAWPEPDDDVRSPEMELAAAEAVADIERAHARQTVDEMDAGQTLAEVASTRQAITTAEVRQLVAVAHWADLHGILECPSRVRGSEMLVRPGGNGTPELAEFAAAELGAVLGVTAASALLLIGDALDLRHRLPLLCARMHAGEVKVWVARKVAQRTRRLTREAAATVDAKMAVTAASLPFGRLSKVLDATILAADPPQAVGDTEAAAAQQGVWVARSTDHGYGTVFARAAAPDLAAFDASLDVVARALKILGDPDAPDLRRAKAIGVLAHPQDALDLVASAETSRKAASAAARAARTLRGNPTDESAVDRADDDSAESAGRARCVFGSSIVYVHIRQQELHDLATGQADAPARVARLEAIGPVILGQAGEWLGSRHITVRPVLDLAGMPAVDCYEIPDRMAEAVLMEKPADCFPYSPNLSRSQDGEHTIAYIPKDKGGPPGQTARWKLGRLGRGNHRIKTHGRWKVSQPRSGVWVWRSPHGYYFLVDRNGTTALGKL